jgi:hypothetical protein
VRDAAGELIAAVGSAATDLAPLRARLAEQLQQPMHDLGYEEYFLVGPGAAGLKVVGATRSVWLDHEVTGGYFFDFVQGVMQANKGAVSRPVRSAVPRPDAQGNPRVGVPNMAVATPLHGPQGDVVGALMLEIDPTEDFTRILRLASFGESGETYAFDPEGRMLSQSRFDEDLRQLGLLTDDLGLTSVLQLEVRDPGVDMTCGLVPALSRSERPLTRSVAAAAAGEDGVDVVGYRDYRGVTVVGAWRWLAAEGLGVTTEVDYVEAFAPLVGLRWAFGVLVGLTGLTGFGTLGFMFVAARSEAARRQAEKAVESMGQYQLEEKLGQGGMGTVFLGRHSLLRRPTAVKILEPSDGEGGEGAIARFEREVQATCQLANPHTISIYDYGHTPDNKFFYAMEYLDGLTLGKLIEVTGPLSPERAVALLLQVCESLAEAHGEGFVHRDIKPDNILVCARGGLFDFVKVLDFGLVKQVEGTGDSANLTAQGLVMGTPLYMPPEQVLGVPADARADVYSVGCVGYHLLTGSPPVVGKSVFQILTAHCKDPVEAPSQRLGGEVPSDLETLLLACLEKDRADRPADAKALLEQLRALPYAHTWTQRDAAGWWDSHGEEAKACAGEAAADPTGLSWLAAEPKPVTSKTVTMMEPDLGGADPALPADLAALESASPAGADTIDEPPPPGAED